MAGDVTAIELRVQHPEDLRNYFLDGLLNGGLFVPGIFALPAGSPVVVHVFHELPTPGSTILTGIIVWRRMMAGAQGAASSTSGTFPLRPGVGVEFDPAMRTRLLFLDRLERGTTRDGRTGVRYPAQLRGELSLRGDERALEVAVDDVGPRGVRVLLPATSVLSSAAAVRLWLTSPESGASSFAALAGHVAWVDKAHGDRAGLHLELGSREDRLHWARVFNRCREDFEGRFVRVDSRKPPSPDRVAG
jgi:hypothetical protein